MARWWLLVGAGLHSVTTALGQSSQLSGADLDQFTYQDNGTSTIFPPSQWSQVQCPSLNQCLGWPDKYDGSIGWTLSVNSCEWCPNGTSTCGLQHQAPIPLDRNVVFKSSPFYNACPDTHWMAYFDSTCTWDDLVAGNAFSIERHALRVVQPLEDIGNGTYQLACARNGRYRMFGKLDYPHGFAKWWYLSNMEIHVPSEHTQNGKVYDAEIHLNHFYSIAPHGIDNEMGTVAIFLSAEYNSPDYDFLNRLICQWRKVEEENRQQCNIPSVVEEYPGCYYYQRGFGNTTSPYASQSGGRRNLRSEEGVNVQTRKKAISAHDIILHNYMNRHKGDKHKRRILHSEHDFTRHEDFDWEAFIESQYAQEEARQGHRHLMDYEHVNPWFNYFPMIGVKTEYYFRYGGSQTVPPCFGKFVNISSHNDTDNWRVMKDPIRVSQRQINELNRLLKDRIAPANDPLVPCQPDTAGKAINNNRISVARPLQERTTAHQMVFCECVNWGSFWHEDRDWCRQHHNITQRLLETPYNFLTNGFG